MSAFWMSLYIPNPWHGITFQHNNAGSLTVLVDKIASTSNSNKLKLDQTCTWITVIKLIFIKS